MLSWLVLLSAPLHLLQVPTIPEKPGLESVANPALAPQEAVTQPLPAAQEAVAQPAPAPLESDPKAVALFEDLILAQATEKNLPTVQGFSMFLDIRLFDPEGGNEFLLGLSFRSEPMETVRLVVDDASRGTRIEKGFDADGFWLRDAEQNLIPLDSHEFTQDREAIDEAMVLCNDFLLLFDLKRLRKKATQLQLLPFEELQPDGKMAVIGQLITGKLRRGRESWGFELLVPTGSKLPTRLSLQPPAPTKGGKPSPESPAPLAEAPKLPPRFHYAFGDWTEHEGRLLPAWIEEFSGEDLIRPIRLMEIQRFAWRQIDRIQTRR